MRMKLFLVIPALFLSPMLRSQTNWTWMSGNASLNVDARYGNLGESAADATPGSRIGAASWTDLQGNVWIFGGKGNGGLSENGVLNDLWKYNTTANQWTWMGGSKVKDAPGAFVEKGTPSASNNPGGRHNAVFWTDQHGNFWLFGGLGMPSQKTGDDNQNQGGDELGMLNDLWMFSPVSGQWTFVSGSEKINVNGEYGQQMSPSENNFPGGRYSASGWTDGAGSLWLFGGRGYSDNNNIEVLDDVWKYNIADNSWTWINGDKHGNRNPHYGQKGNPAPDNTPGGRHGCLSWTDNNGDFWLYGGGTLTDLFADLWKYDRQANQWTWMSGSNDRNVLARPNGTGISDDDVFPGARTLSAVWVDSSNDIWVFGGNGFGGITGSHPLNDLWKYSTANNRWDFVRGDLTVPTVSYGTKGVPNETNHPGGTGNASYWEDKDGNFWVYGGRRTATDYLDQVWKLSFGCTKELTGSITPASATMCEGDSIVLTATGGVTYEWKRNGVALAEQTGSTLLVTEAGSYSADIIDGACRASADNTVEIKTVSVNGARYNDITVVQNVPFNISARDIGVQFLWVPPTGIENPASRTTSAVVNEDAMYVVSITTAEGCKITDTQYVKVKPSDNVPSQRTAIKVPSAFTPDGNNVNDRLRPLGSIAKLEYFRVFNRWGNLIFQTSVIGEGWDGRFKGAPQPSETYTWLLSASLPDGTPVKTSGKTYLIR